MEDFKNYPEQGAAIEGHEQMTVEEFVLKLCKVDAIEEHKALFEKYGAKYAAVLQDMEDMAMDEVASYLEHHTAGFQKAKCKVLLWDMEEAHKQVKINRFCLLQSAKLQGWQGSGKDLLPWDDDAEMEADFKMLFGKNYEHCYNEAIKMLTGKSKAPVSASNHASGIIGHEEAERPTGGEMAALPKELATDEAKALFARCEHCQADGGLYRWTGTKALFGFFVDAVSGYLEVRPSNDRLPWRIFAPAFQMSQKDINTARQAVNGYKNNRASKPDGWREIERITTKI